MVNEQPLVSVIIPTFNRESLIAETLDSVLIQSYPNWECLVIDDGSTDHTHEVVQGYVEKDNRFAYHRRPGHLPKGANACRNFGFELSRGAYINWFDDDDIMHPDKLSGQVAALEQSRLNFAVCQTMIFEGQVENTLGLRTKSIASDNALDDFVGDRIKWLTQAPLFKKDFLLRTKLQFNEDLHRAQEWEFFVRLLAIEDKYLTDDRPLVFFRQHANSISSGKVTREKIESSMVAAQKALEYQSRLSSATIAKLRRTLINFYIDLLENRFFSAAARRGRELKRLDFSLWYKIKMDLTFISYFLFNRGYRLLK
jgi:glycosyltransferase involved in cell wall biosynthesis